MVNLLKINLKCCSSFWVFCFNAVKEFYKTILKLNENVSFYSLLYWTFLHKINLFPFSMNTA
jgi:hypothetical protein